MISSLARGFAMEFLELVNQRRSVRSFTGQDVEQDTIDRILRVARSAPSAGGLKAYKIITVRDDKTKRALSQAAHGQDFVALAPVVLVFLADENLSAAMYGLRGAKLFCVQDATIATAYAQLAAGDQGLASCWVGAFSGDAVRQAVGARSRLRPVPMLPIGYAA